VNGTDSHLILLLPNFTGTSPSEETPGSIRAVYKLPSTGGAGVIANVDAFHYPTAENDLGVFSAKFKLPACTKANGCFPASVCERYTTSHELWLVAGSRAGYRVGERYGSAASPEGLDLPFRGNATKSKNRSLLLISAPRFTTLCHFSVFKRIDKLVFV
jgi:hypothetical protein